MATGSRKGSAFLTASGQIGVAGAPLTISAMHLISSSTASVGQIKAVGTGGTVYISETGTLSQGVTFEFGTEGFYFPAGAYFTADANLVSVLISYDMA